MSKDVSERFFEGLSVPALSLVRVGVPGLLARILPSGTSAHPACSSGPLRCPAQPREFSEGPGEGPYAILEGPFQTDLSEPSGSDAIGLVRDMG